MATYLDSDASEHFRDHRREESCTSFEETYQRLYWPLVGFCRRQLCGSGDAEGIAQEAFTKAWLSFHLYTADRPFWPWLATIARRLCIDHRREHVRRTSKAHVLVAIAEQPPIPPDERIELAEEHRLALKALEHLKPGEQRMVQLRDIDGWSYEQIARFEGVTVESIRGSLKRARASMRTAYQRLAHGAPAAAAWSRLRRVPHQTAQVAARAQSGLRLSPASWTHLGEAVAGALAVSLAAVTVAPTLGHAPSADVAPGAPTHTVASAGDIASPQPLQRDEPGGNQGDQRAPIPAMGFGGWPPLLTTDRVVEPEDAAFTEFTPSPHYERDGTVFGVAAGTTGCVQQCAVLFRSTDRGGSWERLPAAHFGGGRLLLPPAFPADPRVFATGPTGLQVSGDGGATFTTVAPFIGPAFLSPHFAQGDQRVMVGAAPGWEYRADVGTTTPMTVAPPATNTSPSFTIAFSDTYAADRAFFIGGSLPTAQSFQTSTVFRCGHGGCGPGVVLSGSVGNPTLLLVSGSSGSSTLFAWRTDALFASRDGGSSYARLRTPTAGDIRSLSADGNGTLFLLVEDEAGSRLFRSADGGASWVPTGPALPGTPRKVVVLPGGTLLSAPKAEAGGGILCSTDEGASWRRRCS